MEIFDLTTSKVSDTLTVDEGVFLSAAYSRDGRLLATGYTRKNWFGVLLWDTATKKVIHRCGGATYFARTLAFTPDDKFVLTYSGTDADEVGTVTVWSVASGKLVEAFNVGNGGGERFALSPDGNTLVTLGYNGTLRRWDFAAIRKEFEAKAEKK